MRFCLKFRRQVEKVDNTLVKTEEKTISHRASNRASSIDQPQRDYCMVYKVSLGAVVALKPRGRGQVEKQEDKTLAKAEEQLAIARVNPACNTDQPKGVHNLDWQVGQGGQNCCIN